jgi:glycosyltransferase involved in cell wall biosynthesis
MTVLTKKPLKLVFIAPGSLVHTIKWLNGLAKEHLEVTLITQHKVTGSVDDRVTIKYLPYIGGKGYFLNALALHHLVKKINPDVINVHYASGYGTLALLANIKPYILSVWGSDVYEFPFQSKFKFWLINQSLNNASHIASTSFAMAEQVKLIVKDNSFSISITPFGVDLECFSCTRAPFQSDSITIGIVKRLEHKYGLDLLIKAFAEVKKYYTSHNPELSSKLKLTIVGDGSLESELTQLSQDLNIAEQVEFVGAVENTQVPKYINNMDVFVVPSRIESFGVAAIEALACERPCIVANTGGLPEVITDKVTGIVASYESINSLVESIIWVIENQAQAINMGEKGREDVLAKYSQQAAITTMTNLYRSFYGRPSK